MKNDLMKRALCMVCCLSLTLGVFTYRPPKAEASFVSGAAALGCAVLISTIIGTTADMAFDDVVVENIGNVIDPFVQEFVDFAGGVYENVNEVYSTIAGSANPLAGGVLALSDEAGALIVQFISWLRTEKGLVEGGVPLNFGTIDTDFSLYNGFKYPNIENHVDSSVYPYTFIFYRGSNVFLYYTSEPVYLVSYTLYLNPGLWGWSMYNTVKNSWVVQSLDEKVSSASPLLDISSTNYFLWSSYDVLRSKSVYFEGSLPVPIYSDDAQLQPKSEFQSIPIEIPAGQSLTVNTGLTDLSFTDEQAAADAIFSAALAGTLSPAVAVEDTATDIPGTDTETGTDTDDSILSWTKKIWQTVTDIPSAIAEAIASVFVPDAELINEITGTFNSKFGFVETLHTVGADLLSMDADTAPPVVYIHLEDAEGGVVWGGTEKALDMTWYQRYKADVDRVLSGFLWLAYLWLLFKRAPDILAGAGLMERESNDIYMAESPDGLGDFMAPRRRR